MEKQKLTEKINSLKVSKNTKDSIIKIAEEQQIQIQQVCRKLLTKAIKEYFARLYDIIIEIRMSQAERYLKQQEK
jgi:hypothetical protein